MMLIAQPQININANPLGDLFEGGFANGAHSKVCAQRQKTVQNFFKADIKTTDAFISCPLELSDGATSTHLSGHLQDPPPVEWNESIHHHAW